MFKIILFIATIILTISFSGCTSPKSINPRPVGSAAVEPKKDTTLTVYYGTNRKPQDSNDHTKGYTDKRADELFVGTCKVNIPKEHIEGEIKGSIYSKIIHLDSTYGDITLGDIKRYQKDIYWSKLRAHFKDINVTNEALIFIHGYNNSFKDSAIRSAQMGHDLKINGAVAFYSWPSQDREFGYTEDEATIGASEKYIKEFLTGFAEKSGAKVVHIIAHSMGNRGLLRVINDIQKENLEKKDKKVRFGQIILAAPDVDADLFRDISKAYTELSKRTTLYVSPKDKALWGSEWMHGQDRAGLTEPVTIIKGIDTIKVNFPFKLLKLGHGYALHEIALIKDIKDLLHNNTAPIHRKKLSKKNKEGYWLLNLM